MIAHFFTFIIPIRIVFVISILVSDMTLLHINGVKKIFLTKVIIQEHHKGYYSQVIQQIVNSKNLRDNYEIFHFKLFSCINMCKNYPHLYITMEYSQL